MYRQIEIRVENIIYPIQTILFTPSEFFDNLFHNNKFIEYNQDIIDLDITTEDWLLLTDFLNFLFKKTYVNYVNDPWNLDSDSKESFNIDLDAGYDIDDNIYDDIYDDDIYDIDDQDDIDSIDINNNNIDTDNDNIEISLKQYILKLTWKEYYGLKNTLNQYLFSKLAILLEQYEIERLMKNFYQENYQELVKLILKISHLNYQLKISKN